MTDYFIRKNVLGSNCRSVIKDANGADRFLMVGRWGSRGDVFSLYQMDGTLIASIKQSSFAFRIGTRFDLYLHGEKIGTLQHLFSFKKDIYYVRQLGWAVIGEIHNQRYSIYHLNQKIMTLSQVRRFDRLELKMSVLNEEEAPVCLCIAAVLDYWATRPTSFSLFKSKKQPAPFPIE